ncbi:hypothetical protein AA313_de0201032 [Arthrobotrys entomopaga]|nr:hypothetical protein AA313_de0201032 [Arthrobotrys entomopaga]
MSPSATTTPVDKQARSHAYDFAGPLGVGAITIVAPTVSYLLYFGCNEHGCPPTHLTWPQYVEQVLPTKDQFFSLEVLGCFASYVLGLALLNVTIPVRDRLGVPLKTGERLVYNLNAYETFIPLMGSLVFGTYVYGWEWSLWTWIWDHYLHLLTAAHIFSLTLACAVYVASFRSSKPLLAAGGNSGNHLYDWFIGRELNPRIGNFDIKLFCELHPGMMGWAILNLAFAAHQYQTIGRITDSMVLINIFQFWYIFDALFNEPAILTTMDITSDGFGYMLSFGDIVWVPFTYSLQARYLAMYPLDLGILGVAGVLFVKGVGYFIFRGANSQKNAFRMNPDDASVKHLKFIETKSGRKLLVSGWWGISRHINYFGDWIMGWSWCLPTGFDTWVTYFYVGYFAVLLINRERRDDGHCRIKYGEDWNRYTSIVRSRIVPGIY